MIVLGLTGSIGMGKSTALGIFAALGCPTWDADEAVHRLYRAGGAGAAVIARLAPETVSREGVDRARLRAAILADEGLLQRIEAEIHPLVAEDREAFLARARRRGARIAVCDIPLLFETGAERWLDRVAVVSVPTAVQRARVLARPGMTEAMLDAINANQVPDADKRARADFVIDSSGSKEHTREQIRAIVAELMGDHTDA